MRIFKTMKCTYLGLANMACCTKYARQPKWTANCESTVNIVYKLKMLVSGRSFDNVFNGLDREINRKQVASKMPCNVA